MIRNFARINSVPHYRIETPNDDTENNQPTPDTAPSIEYSSIILPGVIPMSTSTYFIHPHEEYQYLNLIYDILQENQTHVSRNGNTLSVFGAAMVFSLEQGTIPILTTKQMAWKTCLKELLWFTYTVSY